MLPLLNASFEAISDPFPFQLGKIAKFCDALILGMASVSFAVRFLNARCNVTNGCPIGPFIRKQIGLNKKNKFPNK